MKHIFFRPLDTQFHRDSHPFQAGVETDASSIFPPFPTTIYGALRTMILTQFPYNTWWTSTDLVKVTGTFDFMGSLNIRGPIIAAGQQGKSNVYEHTFYPAPLDLLRVKKTKHNVYVYPNNKQDELKKCSNLAYSGLYPCLPEQALHLEEQTGFLSHDYLEQYLTGRPIGNVMLKPDELFLRESRLGIGLNHSTRTASQKLLYTASHIRMRDSPDFQAGLLIGVDEDNNLIPDSGITRLGGDGRPVAYNKVKNIEWSREINLVIKKITASEGRFKAYLITPAIFQKNGWFPDFLKMYDNAIIGDLPGLDLKVKLVGTCVGRTVNVGGFDMNKKHPKVIQKAVPAGSVYFFQFVDWNTWDEKQKETNVERLLSSFFYQALTDRTDTQGFWKQGFGTTLIGGW